MPASGRSITFELEPSFEEFRGQRLLVARIVVSQDISWDMILNPTIGRSRIAPHAFEDLVRREGPPPRRDDRPILRNLTIDGQALPNLVVVVDPGVTRLRIDGILGLDFFAQFEEVRWQPRTRLVTLIEP